MLIKGQLIITLKDQESNTIKTYQIILGNNFDYIVPFLSKNSDIIEAEGITPNLQLIFKSHEANFGVGKLMGKCLFLFRNRHSVHKI